MRSNVVRVLAGIALIVAAIVLLVLLKNTGNENGTSGGGAQSGGNGIEPSGQTSGSAAGKEGAHGIPTIVIKGGKPVGGIKELTYSAGDQIRFKVDSDVSDEVHVHGYDLMKDVKAGGSVSFDFPATIEGVFEAELENRGEQILELRVNP